MSLFPARKEKEDTPVIPRPGFIHAINYWRALQILKQTPFRELWAATKKEAPGLLAVFVFVIVCLFSVIFTAGWCVVTVLKIVWRTLVGLFSWAFKK